jgi:hypothetical protein
VDWFGDVCMGFWKDWPGISVNDIVVFQRFFQNGLPTVFASYREFFESSKIPERPCVCFKGWFTVQVSDL